VFMHFLGFGCTHSGAMSPSDGEMAHHQGACVLVEMSPKVRDISSRTCLMLFFSHSYTSSLWLRSHISKNWRYRSNQITSNKPTNQTTSTNQTNSQSPVTLQTLSRNSTTVTWLKSTKFVQYLSNNQMGRTKT
jgi:hypothetical protein